VLWDTPGRREPQVSKYLDILEGAKPAASPLLIAQAETYLTFALDPTWPDNYRDYFLGVYHGFAIAFGVMGNIDLLLASTIYGAQPDDQPELAVKRAKKYKQPDEVIHASGVLYGYKRGIAEAEDASECAECGRGIRETLDDFASCECGIFCDGRDCFEDYDHLPACRLEREAADADDAHTDLFLDK
jgi:hypothetical protein